MLIQLYSKLNVVGSSVLEFVSVLEARNTMSVTLMNFYYFKKSRTIAALNFVFYFLS